MLKLEDKCLAQKQIKRRIFAIIGLPISGACLYFAFKGIHWISVIAALKAASYSALVLSLFFQLISLTVAGYRWKMIINLPEVSWTATLSAMMVGLMVNNVLPGRIGELVRPVLLGQETKVSKVFLFATVMIDRFLDLIVLVILGFLSFSQFPATPWAHRIALTGGLFVVVFLLLAGLCYSNFRIQVIPNQYRSRLEHLFAKFSSPVQNFKQGFARISSIRRGLKVFGISCLVWSAWFLSMYYALGAFHLSLPVWGGILLLATLNLSGLIPSSPGYVGTYHLLAVVVLSIFGVEKEKALSFILVFHAIWYVPQTILGVAIIIRKHLTLSGLQQYWKREEQDLVSLKRQG